MLKVSVPNGWIYGARCGAACVIAALQMVWVKQDRLVLRMPWTNFEKLPHGGLQNDVPRMQQRSVKSET